MITAEDQARARAVLDSYGQHKQGIPGKRCSVGDDVAAVLRNFLDLLNGETK